MSADTLRQAAALMVRAMPCVDGPHRIVTATVDGWPTSLCEVCGEAWWVLEQRMREAL